MWLVRSANKPTANHAVSLMGLKFPNRVGLAAGLDKNGEHIDALADCGFGFIEIGTVTPLPQPGNDRPRLFRLVSDTAIINRMGFNNHGVDYLLEQVIRSKRHCVLGINIGKNKDTPNERAIDDYIICLRKVYAAADYVVVNISSPNTPGLRDLQHGDALRGLLIALKREQRQLAEQYLHYKPLLVKIAPDLDDAVITSLADAFIELGIDGVVATNTTHARDGVQDKYLARQQGGLSGAPLRDKADHVLGVLAGALHGRLPIIAVGGIINAADAERKLALGASLIQLYTGFIYQGPRLVTECISACQTSP